MRLAYGRPKAMVGMVGMLPEQLDRNETKAGEGYDLGTREAGAIFERSGEWARQRAAARELPARIERLGAKRHAYRFNRAELEALREATEVASSSSASVNSPLAAEAWRLELAERRILELETANQELTRDVRERDQELGRHEREIRRLKRAVAALLDED